MVSQKIRTFIALELPPAVITLLDSVQQDLKSLGLKAKWVRPGNIHLTLKFLGDIDATDVDRIGGKLAAAALGFTPFRLSVGGLGFFPGIRRPRVVWVGLGGENKSLFKLQRRVEEDLASIGYPKEKRSFKAHLTLGRIRRAVDPDVIRQAQQQFADLNEPKFTVDRIILFKSDLKPSGAVYSQLKKAELCALTNDA